VNIKAIHIIFICASIILAFFFAVWAWGYGQQEGHGDYKTASIASGLIGLGLIVYAFYFVKKAKSL
jgi:hypothetical protein